MKQVPTSKGFVALVDDEDFERVSRYSWHAHNCGGKGGNQKRPARTVRIDGKQRVRWLVHEIMKAPPGLIVDHINGDPWDNRRCNLRIGTQSQNCVNRQRTPGKYLRGVSRSGKRWRAALTYQGKHIGLGSFDTEIAAHAAYVAASKRLNGDWQPLPVPFPAASSIGGAL